ncbi:hypothetical protein [Metabacillus idriensis]|uniref:hypothetical protein n=1 Tax=Metabacillus idriensis TaxID=324768 RepID=UPI00174A83B3|nr:hypothetical protein [Metabacillus idriensis]
MAWMPAGSETNEEIDAEIKKLEKRIADADEERRALRLSKGQKPEPPKDFVSPELSAVLVERVTPIFAYAAYLAEVLLESDIPVDMSDFDKYEDDLKLLRMSIDPEHGSKWVNTTNLIHVMDLYSKGEIEAKTTVRGIANVFRMGDLLTEIYSTNLAQEIIDEDAECAGFSISNYEEALAYYYEIESELDEREGNLII